MSHLQQKTSQNWTSQMICLFTLGTANRSSNCPCGPCQSQTQWVTPSFLGKRPGRSLVLSEALIQHCWILLHSLVHPVVTLSHPAGSISRMFFRMASQTWLLTPPEEVIAALWSQLEGSFSRLRGVLWPWLLIWKQMEHFSYFLSNHFWTCHWS